MTRDMATQTPMQHVDSHAACGPSTPRPSRATSVAGAMLFGILAVTWLGRMFEGFEDDDLQHLHAAWMISRGMVPYRDYFDHHMPLFHVVFAPYALLVPHDPLTVLVTSRLMALVPAAAALWLMAHFASRAFGAGGAATTLGAVLGVLCFAVTRHADLIFELRPDYCALPFMLAAVALLALAWRDWAARARTYLWAGLCVGISICFTQKMLALAPAFVLWQGGMLVHSLRDLDRRRVEAVRLTALVAGMALPLTALVAALAHVGALHQFLAEPIGFGAHWRQPEGWQICAQEPVLFDITLIAPGYAWALLGAWRWLRSKPEAVAGDGLLSLLALCGTAGFLRTPAPSEQAYLLTTQVWVVACAVRAIGAALSSVAAGEPLWKNREARWALAAAVLGSLAMLRWYNALIGLAALALAAWAVAAIARRVRRPDARAVAVVAVLCLAPALIAIGTAADRIHRAFVWNQLAAMRAIDRAIPADAQVLTLWPIYTPFRPSATYHWFSDRGMYGSLPPGTLRDEYERAMDAPRTAAVVCEPKVVRENAPEVMQAIEAHFREAPLPRELRRARLFVRPWHYVDQVGPAR